MTEAKQMSQIIAENDRRNEALYATFNPISGRGSTGKRVRVEISDFVFPVQWLPEEMFSIPLVKKLVEAGSIDSFLKNELKVTPNEDDAYKVTQTFIRLRYRYDFPFWAASLVKIKNKGGGDDVHFRLSYPQRILV